MAVVLASAATAFVAASLAAVSVQQHDETHIWIIPPATQHPVVKRRCSSESEKISRSAQICQRWNKTFLFGTSLEATSFKCNMLQSPPGHEDAICCSYTQQFPKCDSRESPWLDDLAVIALLLSSCVCTDMIQVESAGASDLWA